MVDVSVINGEDPRYGDLCRMEGTLYEGWLSAWGRLDASERDIYTHPAYVMSWVSAHRDNDGAQFILFHLTVGSETISIIPFKYRRYVPGLGVALASPIVEVASSAAIPAAYRKDAVEAIFASRINGHIPIVIGFARIDETNRFGDVDACKLVSETPYTRNYISLPDQYAELIAAKPKLRRNLGVAKRKAAQQGTLSLEIVEQPEDLPAAFEKFAALEYAGWKHDERRAMINNPFVYTLYRNIMISFGQLKQAAVITLYLDSEPISSYLCLIHEDVLYGLKTAFNESYRHLSPGNFLLDHILTEFCPARGITEYNTMSNSPWFRDQYEPALLRTYSLHLFPRGIRGALAKRGYQLFTRLKEDRRNG